MFAVGVDVSNGRSMVAVVGAKRKVIMKPFEVQHTNRQFQLSSKTKTALSNNLIALLEQSYPGVNRYFDSPVRPDGSQKWVDFSETFWHMDCIAKLSQNAFVER